MSGVRLRPFGARAWLLEPTDPGDVLAIAAAAAALPAVAEVVPAARTVLAVLADGSARDDVAGELRSLTPGGAAGAPDEHEEVVLDVHYDGADLTGTAAEVGVDVGGLVRAHSSGGYVVAFCGSAYPSGLDDRLHLSRLDTPRTRLPAGS